MKKAIAYFKRAFVLPALLLLSYGLAAQQTISGSFSSKGQNRSYSGAIPDNPDSNLRLVILFCGAYEFGFEMHNRGFDDHLGTNTVAIYPEPFVTGTSFGNPNVANGADDYQMVEDLITHLRSTYSIDTGDICIGGFSAGALFSYGLVCEFNRTNSSRPYRFRAMASVSGAFDASYLNYSNCPVANAVPLIAFHGTTDNLANYQGGDLLYTGNVSANVDTALAYWSSRINGCNATPMLSTLPDSVTEQPFPSTVEFRDYGCQFAQRTHLYRIVDGRHSWPGGDASWDLSSGRNQDIDASELIADFFDTVNNLSRPEVGPTASSIKLFPNPLNNSLHLESEIAIDKISIYNSAGTPVFSRDSPHSSLNLQQLPAGFYLVHVQTGLGIEVRRIIKE